MFFHIAQSVEGFLAKSVATCARKPKIPGLSLAASYVQR